MALAPRVRRSFAVIGHSPDNVELRTGIWNAKSFTVEDASGKGRILNVILGLDGSVSRRDLARREGVSRADVEAVVDHLYSIGAIEETPTSALDAYLDSLQTLGRLPSTSDVASSVLVLGEGEIGDRVVELLDGQLEIPVERPGPDEGLWRRLLQVDPGDVHDGLRLSRLAEEFAPWSGAFAVIAEPAVEPVRMQILNRLAHEIQMSFIHGVIDGPFLFVGPTVIPHRSACWECFESRVTMNLRESASYLAYKNALVSGLVRQGRPPLYPALVGLVASHLALEATNYLTTGSTFTIEKALGMYLPTMEIAYNEVLRLPGCRGCGSDPERDGTSLMFDPRSWLDD